ncbi:MAG: site-specific integrase [Rikenellaceae bacterium]
MSSIFKVLFYLRKNYLNKEGKAPIMVRITLNGEISQFSSKLDIEPKQWDTKATRAIGRTKSATDLNLALDNIKSSIILHYRRLCERSSVVGVAKLRNAYLGIEAKEHTLMAIIDKDIADVERSIEIAEKNCKPDERPDYITSPATLQKYRVTKKRLSEFMKRRRRIKDIPLVDIDHKFVLDFEKFLRVDSQCGVNTTGKFMRNFKRVLIMAKNYGWMTSDPFGNYKIQMESVDRGYLTQAELEILLQKKFTVNRLEQVRDFFIFACFTGLAYVDVRNLTQKDICTSFDGNLWIMMKRQKTNVLSRVMLLDIPKKILEKYSACGDDKTLLPIPSNQKLTQQGKMKRIRVTY